MPPGISDCPVFIPWLSRCIPWCQLFPTVEFRGGSLLAWLQLLLSSSRTGHGHLSLVLAALVPNAVGFAALGPHLAAIVELRSFPGWEFHREQGPACVCKGKMLQEWEPSQPQGWSSQQGHLGTFSVHVDGSFPAG